MRKEQGISLIELMISVCLASFLIILVMNLYLQNKKNYLTIHRLLERNLDLQLISDLIRQRLRRAGFTPCLSLNLLESRDSRNGKTNLDALIIDENEFTIQRMSEHFTLVLQQISSTALLLKSEVNFSAKETILLADCYHAEVHQIAAVQKTTKGTLLHLEKAIFFQFVAPIYGGEWLHETFYMQKNKKGMEALFYRQNHPEELSTAVKQLLITAIGRQRVRVSLGLENSAPYAIEAKVRNE